jgi:hypothetical protein
MHRINGNGKTNLDLFLSFRNDVGVWLTGEGQEARTRPAAPQRARAGPVSLELVTSRLGLAGMVLVGNDGFSQCRQA